MWTGNLGVGFFCRLNMSRSGREMNEVAEISGCIRLVCIHPIYTYRSKWASIAKFSFIYLVFLLVNFHLFIAL